MRAHIAILLLMAAASTTAGSITRGPDQEEEGGPFQWDLGHLFERIVGRVNEAADSVASIFVWPLN